MKSREYQGNLGDEFAPGAQLGMPIEGEKGHTTPLGDEESLAARAERLKMLQMGQLDMFEEGTDEV